MTPLAFIAVYSAP